MVNVNTAATKPNCHSFRKHLEVFYTILNLKDFWSGVDRLVANGEEMAFVKRDTTEEKACSEDIVEES